MKPEELEQLIDIRGRIEAEVRKNVVGLQDVLNDVLLTLFAGGHALLVGVPGLAKTRLIKAVAGSMHLGFRRIQFTPDLMPSDVTGMEVLEEEVGTGKRATLFVPGPVFTNVLLADEINRTPPRTQAALLECMQERQVTVGRRTMPLDDPFFVLATQNPIEQEGTYPLPEAQLDRFMFQIEVGYPSASDELTISLLDPVIEPPSTQPVIEGARLNKARSMVRSVVIAETVTAYAVALARASRPADASCPAALQPLIAWGAGPRAAQYLVLAARTRAALSGRAHVSVEDLQAVAPNVLRHRIIPSYVAEAEGVGAAELVRRLLAAVPAPAGNGH